MPRADFVLCDVFTDRPFAGNQLAVFPDARDIPEDDLQRLAREFNFSEVTYLYPAVGDGDARLRIFTPETELPFAGHPTLGSAAVVAHLRQTAAVVLETGVGVVPVQLEATGDRRARGWMHQPVPTATSFADADALLEVLGVDKSLLPVEVYDNGVRHLFVALPDESAVAALRVDVARLTHVGGGINCFAGAGTRWKTRCFFDGLPAGEDPATGSAAGPLLYHLVRHGLVERGAQIEISQGAELGRPSALYARTDGGDDPLDGIHVGGDVVIVGDGTLTW